MREILGKTQRIELPVLQPTDVDLAKRMAAFTILDGLDEPIQNMRERRRMKEGIESIQKLAKNTLPPDTLDQIMRPDGSARSTTETRIPHHFYVRIND